MRLNSPEFENDTRNTAVTRKTLASLSYATIGVRASTTAGSSHKLIQLQLRHLPPQSNNRNARTALIQTSTTEQCLDSIIIISIEHQWSCYSFHNCIKRQYCTLLPSSELRSPPLALAL